MSLTNDDITAQNFKEFYENIKPYLNGSFPTPIANKFSKSDLYSTSERMIGQWVDGKPLYQKSIYTGALPNNSSKQVTIDSFNSIDKVVNMFGFAYLSSGGVGGFSLPKVNPDIAIYVNGGGWIQITTSSDYSTHEGYVTLQYTKTTDAAISIGSDTDYSTTEKVVGTWIDGKPLYQCTWNFNSIIDIPANDWADTPISSSNIDKLIDVKLYRTSFCHGGGSAGINTTTSKIRLLYPVAKSIDGCTLQYTKTTD